MATFFGILTIVIGLVLGFWFLYRKITDWKGFLAIWFVAVTTGAIFANFSHISGIGLAPGGGSGFLLQIEKKAERVEERAGEVEKLAVEMRNIKGQIDRILESANATNDKITTSEKNTSGLLKEASQAKEQISTLSTKVQSSAEAATRAQSDVAAMQQNIRQSIRSIFESFAYAIGTRNLFPPPDFVNKEIDRHLNLLAAFAYPEQNERNREIQKVMDNIKKAQPK